MLHVWVLSVINCTVYMKCSSDIGVLAKIRNFLYHWVVISESNPFLGGLKIHYCLKVAEIIFVY